MTVDNIALRLAQHSAPRFGLDDADAIIEALTGLGYTLETPGARPGRYVESDEHHRGLAEYLRRETGVSWATAHSALIGIGLMGYRIREPDRHPSGLRTTELAFTMVVPFGAKYSAEQKRKGMT